MVNAPVCGSGIRGFNSPRSPHIITLGISQAVRQRTLTPSCIGSNPISPAIFNTICGRGSVVEHRLAKARVEGSNPFVRSKKVFAPIAQLDRAFDYESRGREFESLWVRHFLKTDNIRMRVNQFKG